MFIIIDTIASNITMTFYHNHLEFGLLLKPILQPHNKQVSTRYKKRN